MRRGRVRYDQRGEWLPRSELGRLLTNTKTGFWMFAQIKVVEMFTGKLGLGIQCPGVMEGQVYERMV